MDDDALSVDNKRQNERVRLDLPIEAKVGAGDHMELEIVDISATGMQVRTDNFDVLKDGFDSQHNLATFEIKIEARLAWARPDQDGTFVTGWEFDRVSGEELIG
jgi:hypothetical protein